MARFKSPTQSPSLLPDIRPRLLPILRGRYFLVSGISIILAVSIVASFFRNDYSLLGITSGPFSKKPFQQCPVTLSSNKDGQNNGTWRFTPDRDADNYGLSFDQCQAAFPKLFVEVDKSVEARKKANRPITYHEMAPPKRLSDGMVRVVVDHGEVYVVEWGDLTSSTKSRAKSTLHSLHRALIASPDRDSIPSVEFVFSAQDFVSGDYVNQSKPIFSYTKRDDDESIWLMPDFGYWAWPDVRVGAYRDVRRRIARVESEVGFPQKKQLVWRGSLSEAPELRGKLLKQTRGKHWASIRVLDWESDEDLRVNLLSIEDHCRYMFLAHTEGRSFSGRGKYLFNCRSVVISHRLIWREAHHAALIASGPGQNYVEVERDFSDLEEKVEYLLDHPDAAERIAENSVATFRDRYLTPAAEACYWRYLLQQYASVCDFIPDIYETSDRGVQELRGVPYEEWVLMN